MLYSSPKDEHNYMSGLKDFLMRGHVVDLAVGVVVGGAPPPAPATKSCPECLSDIPLKARRCSHCTTQIA